MAKYRKKPVIIEAFQYVKNMGEITYTIPMWFIYACNNGTVFSDDKNDYIKTLEGNHLISDGDFIIQGVKGEIYPCKENIFHLTYEKV